MLALALELRLQVEARIALATSVRWQGEGAAEVPLNARNLIVRAAQEPFQEIGPPLSGVALQAHNDIPVGRGLGSSAAAIIAGVRVGAKLRGLRLTPERVLELAFPLEGHGDNLAAALHGGFCIAVGNGESQRAHRLRWPERWRAVVFCPDAMSATAMARRLVPRHPARADVVFNLARVAEWVLACTTADGRLLASAMRDCLHQPARSAVFPYLNDTIDAALGAGALGASLSGAGGSVIAICDRAMRAVGIAMARAAAAHGVLGRFLVLNAAGRGATALAR